MIHWHWLGDENTFCFIKRFLPVELFNDNCGDLFLQFRHFPVRHLCAYTHSRFFRSGNRGFIEKSLLEIPSRQTIIHVRSSMLCFPRKNRCEKIGLVKKPRARLPIIIFKRLQAWDVAISIADTYKLLPKHENPSSAENDVIYHLLSAKLIALLAVSASRTASSADAATRIWKNSLLMHLST